jgi:hypothetical protein
MSEQAETKKLVEKCLFKLYDYAYLFHIKNFNSYSSIIDCDVENYKGDFEILKILKEIKLIAVNKKLDLNEITNYVCKYDFCKFFRVFNKEFNISLTSLIITQLIYIGNLNITTCSPLHVCIEYNAKKCFDLLLEKDSSVHIYKYSKHILE